MLIDARYAHGAALCVIQLEVVRALLAIDKVGILAYVKSAFRARKKSTHVAMHVLCRSKILRLRETGRKLAHRCASPVPE